MDNGSVTPPVGDVELPTTVVTQFGDSFNDVISGVVYDSPNWAFTSRVMLGIRPILNWDGSAVYLETRSIFSVLLTAQRRRPLRLML